MSTIPEQTEAQGAATMSKSKGVSTRRKSDRSSAIWVAVPFVVAIVILIGFAWLIMVLMGKAQGASELEWTRAMYLLNGVEAVAFAAAGFLFGREVHRQQAEKAEERATEATQLADNAKETAAQAETRAMEMKTKAESLKAAIEAKVAAQSKQTQPPRVEEFGPAGAPQPRQAGALSNADMLELQVMAEKLFPN
jgi:hypothetical protein